MEIILDETLCLKPNQVKTNVSIPFVLEQNFEKLEILCEYTPKRLDDMVLTKKLIEDAFEKQVPEQYRTKKESWETFSPLSNHVTFSLDYGSEFLGCAHRHPSVQKHTISKDSSTFGFINHSPVSGKYFAVLNIHAIVTESVTYHLKVVAY